MHLRFAAIALSGALLAACQSTPGNGPWLMQDGVPWVGMDGECLQLRPLTEQEKNGFCYDVMTHAYQKKHHYEALQQDEFAFLFPHADPTPASAYNPGMPELAPQAGTVPGLLTSVPYIQQIYTALPFRFNNAHLSARNRKALHASFLNWQQQGIIVVTVAVRGHTDSIGSKNYNLLLSRWRAQSVGYYLQHLGVAPAKISEGGVGMLLPNPAAKSDADNRYVDLQVWLQPPVDGNQLAMR